MDNENAAALEPLRINRMAERNLVIVSFCLFVFVVGTVEVGVSLHKYLIKRK
jgi:hypothetical protein